MSLSARRDDSSGIAGWLARQWRDWSIRPRCTTGVKCAGATETERLARDAELRTAQFSILAGKWPTECAPQVASESATSEVSRS
jgi:hypothetical protein